MSLNLQHMSQEQYQKFEQNAKQVANYIDPVAEIKEGDFLDMIVHGNFRILHVTDPSEKSDKIAKEMKNKGGQIVETCDREKAEHWFSSSRLWDAIVINRHQGGKDKGVALAEEYKEVDADIPIIIYDETGAPRPRSYDKLRDKFTDIDWVKTSGIVEGVDDKVRNGNFFDNHTGRRDESIDGLINRLQSNFTRFRPKNTDVFMLKEGGSLWDLLEKGNRNLAELVRTGTMNIINRYGPGIVMQVGGSEINDTIKNLYYQLGYVPGNRRRENISKDVSSIQSQKTLTIFGEDNARILHPDNPKLDGPITDETFANTPILIVPYAPKEMRRKYRLSVSQSDTQTLAIATYFGMNKVLFMKNVWNEKLSGIGGIYTSDPNRDDFDPATAQKILEISARDFKNEINNTGTDGRGDHLIESDALDFMTRLNNMGKYVEVAVGDVRMGKSLKKYAVEEIGGELLHRFINNDIIRQHPDGSIDYDNSICRIVPEYTMSRVTPTINKSLT